ncbi:MAG: hypothetical protein R6V40_00570 [Candidatus Moraniibacteriota bacterium]
MGIFNFRKKKEEKTPEEKGGDKQMDQFDAMMDQIDTSKLSRKERWALKAFKKLPKSKREDAIRQAMNPQNLYKEKDKVIKQLDEMVKSGQMTKEEAEQMKRQFGLK